MTYRIARHFSWTQQPNFLQRVLDGADAAENGGVDTVFVAEAWGHDATSFLALIAARTKRVKIGTGIINYYSRTPAAIAQTFATLDEISHGRMIIGLGASSANVIEHFHGVPFNPPLTRMRETVEIINMINAGEPLHYHGKLFDLDRGFTLRMERRRDHIPIYLASFRPKAVKVVAEIADGLMPRMIPIDKLRGVVDAYHAYVKAAGRDPIAMTFASPGTTFIVKDKAKALDEARSHTAFYIARMGDYYYEQLCQMGYADEANAVRVAWRDGGSKAGYAAVSDEFAQVIDFVGDVDECRNRLQQEAEGGVTLHQVEIKDAESPEEEARIYEALIR